MDINIKTLEGVIDCPALKIGFLVTMKGQERRPQWQVLGDYERAGGAHLVAFPLFAPSIMH